MLAIPDQFLWLGHAGDSRNPRAILDAGIEAVVDLALEEAAPTLPRELLYCRFPLIDGADNSPAQLRLAVHTTAALLRAEIPTLIFCGAGLSRSPAIAAAALAKVHGQPPEECLRRLHELKGFDVSPGLWKDVIAAVDHES